MKVEKREMVNDLGVVQVLSERLGRAGRGEARMERVRLRRRLGSIVVGGVVDWVLQ